MSHNPYEHDDPYGLDQDEDGAPAPMIECRNPSCRSTEGPFDYFNGWPWCRETCYREITALYMGRFPHPVTDAEAEEYFKQVRRA